MPTGDATKIELDVGWLWVAPLGTTLPTGNATAQAGPIAGFRQVGYTESGSDLQVYQPTIQAVPVAEELYPIRYATTMVEAHLAFSMAESRRANLMLALNAGANSADSTAVASPVTPGSELSVVVMWEAAGADERWVFPSCIQTGPISIMKAKAPAKSLLAVSFAVQKASGLAPFYCWPSTTNFLV